MKTVLAFSLMLLGILSNAQNKHFTYEYKFIPDSTKLDKVSTEIMNLDVASEGSRFYSYTVYHADSTMKVDLEKQLANTGMINIKPDMRKGEMRYKVSKKYPDYQIFFHNQLLGDSYKVTEERKINWKISSEKQKIGNWNAQKAETDFGGRHWVAWFASEIPIQDGPYKFHGLPGLIVKLEDKTGSHIFTLQGVKNISEIPADVFSSKEISVNRKQYQKLVSEYENDPTKGYKQMQVGNITMKMVEGSSKHLKEQEERMKAAFKKDNNRIELIKK